MKDLDRLVEVAYNVRAYLLSLQLYTVDLFSLVYLMDNHTSPILIELHKKLQPDDGEPLANATRHQ